MSIIPQGTFPVGAAVGGIYGAYNVVNTIITSAERASAAAEVVVRVANSPAVQAITNAAESAMEIVSEITIPTPAPGKRLRGGGGSLAGPPAITEGRRTRKNIRAHYSVFRATRKGRKTRRYRRRY